jgi:hypothetical protein
MAEVRPGGADILRGLTRFEWSTESPLWKTNPPLYVAVPHWTLPTAALCPVAAALALRQRHRRRTARGRCLHGGYDLTGNISGVCPECGRSST